MEILLLAIQARVLMGVGMAYVGLGLWLGTDPLVLAWRAPLAALVGMIAAGWLLRQVATVVEERAATELAERQLAAEQEKEKAAAEAAAKAPQQNQALKDLVTRTGRQPAPARAR